MSPPLFYQHCLPPPLLGLSITGSVPPRPRSFGLLSTPPPPSLNVTRPGSSDVSGSTETAEWMGKWEWEWLGIRTPFLCVQKGACVCACLSSRLTGNWPVEASHLEYLAAAHNCHLWLRHSRTQNRVLFPALMFTSSHMHRCMRRLENTPTLNYVMTYFSPCLQSAVA